MKELPRPRAGMKVPWRGCAGFVTRAGVPPCHSALGRAVTSMTMQARDSWEAYFRFAQSASFASAVAMLLYAACHPCALFVHAALSACILSRSACI